LLEQGGQVFQSLPDLIGEAPVTEGSWYLAIVISVEGIIIFIGDFVVSGCQCLHHRLACFSILASALYLIFCVIENAYELPVRYTGKGILMFAIVVA
jgi:hypothetical protein